MFHIRFAVMSALSLALIAPGSAQSPAASGAQTIQVSSFKFAPVPIQLAAGKPVVLTFVNESGASHDFTAKEFFAASSITAGAASNGRIELKPHESQSITLVPRAGTYQAHCSHFMHESMGMHDQIIVR